MVKADFTRDYYGDLEIQPTADLAEIKKQFKKLGMCNFVMSHFYVFAAGRRLVSA